MTVASGVRGRRFPAEGLPASKALPPYLEFPLRLKLSAGAVDDIRRMLPPFRASVDEDEATVIDGRRDPTARLSSDRMRVKQCSTPVVSIYRVPRRRALRRRPCGRGVRGPSCSVSRTTASF